MTDLDPTIIRKLAKRVLAAFCDGIDIGDALRDEVGKHGPDMMGAVYEEMKRIMRTRGAS
jgi:hypothetical protein